MIKIHSIRRALKTLEFFEKILKSSPGSNKGSVQQTPIRSGQILGVKLKNFMCHPNLSVDFNRRANLLIGQNGSGKSAVLTALIIGLGSRANATMRSNSIKRK